MILGVSIEGDSLIMNTQGSRHETQWTQQQGADEYLNSSGTSDEYIVQGYLNNCFYLCNIWFQSQAPTPPHLPRPCLYTSEAVVCVGLLFPSIMLNSWRNGDYRVTIWGSDISYLEATLRQQLLMNFLHPKKQSQSKLSPLFIYSFVQ